MFIKYHSGFHIEDVFTDSETVTFITNKKPDFDMLRQSKTLEKVEPLSKTAAVIKVAPKEEDFLYVRNRAVSAGNVIEKDGVAQVIDIDTLYKEFEKYGNLVRGANANGDFFSDVELKNTYKTFIGKAAFVEHNNANIENARGMIIDAVYNEKGQFVELLKAVDKKAYPELANGIQKGYMTDTSMGCTCTYSICSICGNEARTEDDYCEHVLNYKTSTYNGLPVWEDNRGVEFFEDSFVTQGADPDAKIMQKVASRNYNKIQTHAHYNKYDYILKETNQRFRDNRISKMQQELNNIFTI